MQSHGLSSFLCCCTGEEAGVAQGAGRDTARTAVPNGTNGCPIPCGITLIKSAIKSEGKKEEEGGIFKVMVFFFQRNHYI